MVYSDNFLVLRVPRIPLVFGGDGWVPSSCKAEEIGALYNACVIRIFSGRRKLHEQVEDNFVLLYEDNSFVLYESIVRKRRIKRIFNEVSESSLISKATTASVKLTTLNLRNTW